MHEVSTKIGGHLVMAADDQKLRVRLVGRNGRRRYEAASKERLVTACLEPGVSVSRLALEHGVNANLLRMWIKKMIYPSTADLSFVNARTLLSLRLPRRY
jgi:transposase